MKKLFLLAVGLAMTLTACQKDEGLVSDVATTSSFTVTIPQSGVQTRAVTDAFGTGTSVNRCILEIYHGDKLYDRIEKGVSGKTVTFDNLRLVSSQTYDFVFWADCAEGSEGNFTDKVYNTANLKSITEIGPFVGNSDERDAFFAKESFKVTGSFTKPVTLKRPFGLLVVKTNDLNEIKDEALKPTGYSVAFKGLPTTFNALTGEVSGSADVTYTAGELAKADGTISMDFLWATESEAALSDFTMTFLNNGTAICTNDAFTNIPIRRNYRTNVSGNLLTKKGSISVTIDPNFDANSPIDKVIAEVESVSEVAQAIENGATDITVTTAPTTAATIEIPHTLTAEQAAKEISITLPETDQQVTLAYTTEQNGQAPEAVNITVPTTNKLIINLPESTVTLNGTSYTAVEATTAGNTLIVPEGVTVGKLNVVKGNVEIYGTVTEITFGKGAGTVTTYATGDVATLKKAIELIAQGKCARIVLTADIDLKGSADNPWTPIDTEGKGFVEFDGAGHTIKNLYVDNATGQPNGKGTYYGGFFYVLQGNVKDLTIDGAEVTCYRGGTLVGRMDYGTVENCHMKNTAIKSVQKIGGLIGFVSTSSKDVTVRNCSVTACSIDVFNPETFTYCSQAAGLIGYFQTFERNVLIEGCSVSGITLNNTYKGQDADSYSDGDLFYAMEQSFSHAFIGNMVNVSKKADTYDKYTVELRNNKVDKQADGVATGYFTDEYMGWRASNFTAGYISTAKLIVDGVVKDRWTELKRFVALLKDGGNVNVWYHYDLTKIPETSGEIPIEKPTVIDFKRAVTLTVGKQQIVNKKELTGKGTLDNSAAASTAVVAAASDVHEHKSLIHVTGGDLLIDGVTLINDPEYHWHGSSYNTAAIAYWNDANVTIRNARVISGEFTLCGMGRNGANTATVTLIDSFFESTSSNLDNKQHWAYAMRLFGSEVLIENCEVKGIQGAVSIEENAKAEIRSGKFYTVNTSGQQDAFYALYVSSSAEVTITGGEFSAPNVRTGLQIEGTSAVVSGDNDTGRPSGSVILKGGKFSGKAYNHVTNTVYAPAAGYQWQAITDGDNLKWAVVPATR